MTAIGDRVGAILGANDKVVEFLGYGKYLGEEIPPGSHLPFSNPKIQLDTDEIIWGYQCWWGSEKEIREMVEKYVTSGFSIQTITMAEAIARIERVN
jgi:hypothetical protein